MNRFALSALALLAVSSTVRAQEVCVTGFVMDKFCIDRGALLDPSGLWPLSNADVHTVHCLIDVDACRESGYEILTEPIDDEGNYTRAVELDSMGNDMMVTFGKEVGNCTDCLTAPGSIVAGLRATVKGSLDPDHTGPIPRLLVSDVTLGTEECPEGTELPPPPAPIDYCVTGYVMDKFCIDRNALLDPNGLPPLSNADVHTIHCLIDVTSCRESGYEILTEPADEFGNLTRHVELDSAGNDMLIEYGKNVGKCDLCTGVGSQVAGLRVTVKGTIDPFDDGQIPRLLVEEVLPDTVSCPADQTRLPTPPPAAAVDSPTASPTVMAQTQNPQSVNCAEFQSTVQLGELLTMSYVVTLDEDDETNGQIAIQLVCECQAWVGFAVSEDLFMPNSHAIIGLPLSDEVVKFNIGGARFVSEGDRRAEGEQTLSNATIVSNDTYTVVEFVKRLVEPNEFPINGNGANNFIWAVGRDGNLGSHMSSSNDRGVFSLTLSPCIQGQGVQGGGSAGITNVETNTFEAQWSAHGLLASVAWGIMAPCAIGSSLLRDFIPGNGIWFKIHMMLNSAVLIFTIIAFSLAVNAIDKAGGDPQHFQGETHRSVGLAIFILVIIQVFGGLFRPHAPDVEEEKKPVRFAWEVLHKGSGFGLLGLSWWEVQAGIGLYYGRFGGTDFRPVFWGITGGIAGIIFILWVYRQVSGSKSDAEPNKGEKEGSDEYTGDGVGE